jgi:uncharacterized protein (TIGR03437 family)
MSLAVLILLLAFAVGARAQTALNLSHDLTTDGVAKSNMVPNSPTLDSTPLFQAGVAYAIKNGFSTVTADRGSYYFLSQDIAEAHVYLQSISNLTIDLAYSDLYFANGNAVGLHCFGCSGVMLQNFTMDYINLPFTQVQVTAVNPSAMTINYQLISGWPAPLTLNGYAVTGSRYYLFVFRNGQQLRQTAWMPATVPFSGSTLQVATSGLQGAASSNLAAILPGDTVVVSFRNGGGMLLFQKGSNNTIRNVSIYSSAQLAFDIQNVSNSTFDQLQVIPRPGTDRLISSNADGIHISDSGANNVISNSTVKRACDDALIIDGQWFAEVNGPATGTTVAVTLDGAVTLAPGMSVDFINIADATVFATANITAVSPAVGQQTDGSMVTLTLDHAVSGLLANFGVMPTDPSFRGGGSVIRNNLVQEEVFNRGIYLPGVKNVTATDNLISSTNNGGIVMGEDDLLSYSYKTGTVSGVTITKNVVNNALEYGYPTMQTVVNMAAIEDYVTNENYDYVTTTPESNITITGNLVTNTPRSGIRLQSANGATVSGNMIINANLEPDNYIDLFQAGWGETLKQIEADFAQPIVAADSTGVTNSGNTTTGSIITSVSDASGGLRLASESIASAYGTNLAATTVSNTAATLPTSLGGVSVTVTDTTGTARLAPLFFVSPGQINYQVPVGTAAGVARVTIGSAIGGTLIANVAPGLFSANGTGSGAAAALAVLVSASGTQTPVTVFQCSSSGCVSTPMSLGAATDELVVAFYGTGIQGRSSLANVVASVNGVPAQVLYAGPQTQFPGLDQVNLVIPSSLAGAGAVPVVLTIDGQTANVVTVNIK